MRYPKYPKTNNTQSLLSYRAFSFGWKLFKKSPKMAEQEEKIPTIAEDIVVTKYKMAAEIVNRKLGL